MSRTGSTSSGVPTAPFSPFASSHPSSLDGSDDSDNEDAWDEVDVTHDPRPSAQLALNGADESISIVISKGDGKKVKGKRKGPSDGSVTRERQLRQERHKAHAAALFATGLLRNRWCNDSLLKARLLSITPLHLQNAFFSFSPATHPNERDRSRLFDRALKDLLSWWYQYFAIEPGGLVRRLVSDVDAELAAREKAKGKRKSRESDDDFPFDLEGGERIHWPASMAKHALKRRGTRDMSAQLFTALCRALDIPARLVFSLQPVDWKPQKKAAAVISPKKKAKAMKGKRKGTPSTASSARGEDDDEDEDDDSDDGWVDGRGRLGYKLPPVNLRRSKPKAAPLRSPSPDADELGRAPVFWTEVWARANREWITVDPSRKKMRCRAIMEPSRSDMTNQLLYVIAYEEDGATRDVTARYAKHYSTFTTKARVPSRRGTDFVTDLLRPTQRKFRLNRDRAEDEELGARVAHEPMPTSVAGFKNHPTYVLEQHLKRDEVLLPNAKQLGMFRATEAVYPRSAVVHLKSIENYWRVGRVIKEGEQPMKMVKGRVVTIRKKREEVALQMDGGEVELQGLYSEKQTKLYVPPPVVDGKIPKNDFGNIDLFVPSMLPAGAVHIPNKGAAKCAKMLGLSYADAITGFEFRQRRALPVISGVVVAEDVADVLIEAIISTEEIADEKEFAKRQDRALARWKKLILGLRIRQRLQAAYSAADTPISLGEKESQLGKPSKKRPAAPKEGPPDPPIQQIRPKRHVTTNSKPTITPEHPIPAAVDERKRSTTGRTLRFTVSTEKAVEAKEKARASLKRKAEVVVSDTEEEVQEDDGSEHSLELLSDF